MVIFKILLYLFQKVLYNILKYKYKVTFADGNQL